MKNFYIFSDALEFIEANLCEDITQQDIADASCCSLSALQKVWRYCAHTSIKYYISKRRLAKCAKEILHSDLTITEIAFRYQYNSPEVFTRAFRRMWGIAPSEFRRRFKNADLYPRFIADEENTGGNDMKRKVDLTELYDFLRSKAGTYVLCFDVSELMPVNEKFGSRAGDAVILEAYRRIDEAAGDDMPVFRIGGDEFAMITGLSSAEEAEAVARRVISQNGNTITAEGVTIPVAVRTGALVYQPRPFRYSELFNKLQNAIDNAVDTENVTFIE